MIVKAQSQTLGGKDAVFCLANDCLRILAHLGSQLASKIQCSVIPFSFSFFVCFCCPITCADLTDITPMPLVPIHTGLYSHPQLIPRCCHFVCVDPFISTYWLSNWQYFIACVYIYTINYNIYTIKYNINSIKHLFNCQIPTVWGWLAKQSITKINAVCESAVLVMSMAHFLVKYTCHVQTDSLGIQLPQWHSPTIVTSPGTTCTNTVTADLHPQGLDIDLFKSCLQSLILFKCKFYCPLQCLCTALFLIATACTALALQTPQTSNEK